MTGSDDSLYAAVRCIEYERPGFGQRVGYTGRHFTTLGNTFTVHLPPGAATVRIERGKEYIPSEETITVAAGKTIEKTFRMTRWIHMADRGWYSGDTHVHRALNELADLLHAEDLNVAVPQTVWSDRRADDLDSWLAKADSLGAITVDSSHVFSVLSHEIERFKVGALFMHYTCKTELTTSGADDRTPTNLSLMEQAHALGGYCEVEKPWWPESHIDVAVGKADFIGIANNHMLYKSYLSEHPRLRSEFRPDYPDGVAGYVDYVLDLYYAYLNCGFRVMPSAGSASGVLPNPLGYNRAYVKTDGDFSYENWFRGLKAGRSFVTNGPLLIMTADGQDPGATIEATGATHTVHVVCELFSLVPLSRFEIIRDGGIVFTAKPELTGNTARIEADIPFDESGWCAARCFEDIADNVRFAHTAPVFVEIAGKPFRTKRSAAEYFLRKTDELIATAKNEEFKTPEARKATMDVYNRARDIYAGLVKRGR